MISCQLSLRRALCAAMWGKGKSLPPLGSLPREVSAANISCRAVTDEGKKGFAIVDEELEKESESEHW